MTSTGDGHDKDDDSFEQTDNVVPLKVPRKESSAPKKTAPPTEPILNIPPVTKYLLGFILSIHLIVTFALSDNQTNWAFTHLGFIPGRFTGNALFEPLALLTPITHMFFHGGWLHLAMNTIMLLAFGSGVERWIGGKKFIIFFVISGLFGVALHLVLNFDSYMPVIGASGGISGLFALALIMINRQHGGMTGKYGIWPFIGLWIGISVLFGFIGSPDGSEIAWAAHVGGFLGGFALIKLMKL